MTSDNKNLRQSSPDVLGRPPTGKNAKAAVLCRGLKATTRQSGPQLPRTSTLLPRLFPLPGMPFPKLSSTPVSSLGCSRQNQGLHKALCMPLSPPDSRLLEKCAGNVSAQYTPYTSEVGDSSRVEGKFPSWEVGDVGSGLISGPGYAV